MCEGPVSYFDRSCEQHPCLLGAATVEPAPAYCFKGTSTAFANCPWRSLVKHDGSLPPACPWREPRKLAPAQSITGSIQAQCPFAVYVNRRPCHIRRGSLRPT